MKRLKRLLIEEKTRLEQVIKRTRESLIDMPEGTLRLTMRKGYPQYYLCNGRQKGGSYIPKSEIDLVRKLAQKSYDQKVLRLAEKRYRQIAAIIKDYEEHELEQIYLEEHVERRKFIRPVEATWQQKKQEWSAKEYVGKEFREGTPVILTERGERVRSKSEKIMADYFYRNGIEYKYECPLYLKGVGTVYPDFTLLSRKTGEEIYWEHFGRADDPNYARKMVKKIQAYEANDIYQGERLILTYETEEMILNTKKIEQLVKRYLI